MQTTVQRTADFTLSGTGTHRAWAKADWLPLNSLEGGGFSTRAKLLWSAKGLYAFFDCADDRLRCTLEEDFADLYEEDVVEIFVQPDPKRLTYFEYEVSPLGYELPLMINHDGKKFFGWLPWKYRGKRACRFATKVRGGAKKPGAKVTGWSVELFIPFALLRGLGNVPPKRGTRWRANLFRIDYGATKKKTRHFAWGVPSKPSFHTLSAFGTLTFG
jgi:hypothetical protein